MNRRLHQAPDRAAKRTAFLQLALVCLLSLGLVTTTNALWYSAALKFASPLGWLAETCIASLVLCSLVYLAIRPARPFAGPRPDTEWRRVFGVGGIWLAVWLAASVARAAQAGHWIAYAHGTAALLAFLVFGPLQEEILFRGALFELAERVFPSARAWAPILISSVFFSLHHFELHQYHATPAVLLQVGFTFPMGIVFGILRSESGSLWPAFVLHLLTNRPGCFGV